MKVYVVHKFWYPDASELDSAWDTKEDAEKRCMELYENERLISYDPQCDNHWIVETFTKNIPDGRLPNCNETAGPWGRKMLLGVCGKKGAGKDTVGNYIIEKYGYSQYAFAKPLKKIIKELFDLSDEQLYGSLKETIDPRWNTTPRILMQYIGTELFREQLKKLIPELSCENLWIRKFHDWYSTQTQNVIITDIRFIDEMNAVKQNNGVIIKVVRDLGITDSHISEQFFQTVTPDHIIENNGSMEELYLKIDSLFM